MMTTVTFTTQIYSGSYGVRFSYQPARRDHPVLGRDLVPA
jgi:hypothetical protein